MELTLAVRRQVTERLVARYAKATRAEKAVILDDLCEVNGWHRDHARKALRQAAAGPPPARKPREPVLTFGAAVIDALRFSWAVLDGPTGKRMAPAMPELVASRRRHGELDIGDELADQLTGVGGHDRPPIGRGSGRAEHPAWPVAGPNPARC